MEKFSKSVNINNALYHMGIFNYYQVVHHLPRRYEDYSLTHDTNLTDKERVVLEGKIISVPALTRARKISFVRFFFETSSKRRFSVIAYNRPYLLKMLNTADTFTIVANYDYKRMSLNLVNIIKGSIDDNDRYRPVYSLPMDISNYQFSRLVKKGLTIYQGKIFDAIPFYFKDKYRLIGKEEALNLLHFPKNKEDVIKGYRVMKYEECLLFSLKTQIIRSYNSTLINSTKKEIDYSYLEEFVNKIPFKLTIDQENAYKEIVNDMNKKNLMYRLLQGDVGTGKTLVAEISLYANFLRNAQGALMAPTDSLARQHYETLTKLFSHEDIHIALLLGSTPKSEREVIQTGLEHGVIDIVIGTHALFSADIEYKNLGLVVIDEQHRFGVNQRLLLASKGDHADLLLMSATPIPRTLALTIYGDLDISTITSFPMEGRKIETKVIKDDDKLIRNEINKALENERNVYVVAPMINGTEDGDNSATSIYERFAKIYGDKVTFLHGKMKSDEKNDALSKFSSGRCPIIVSTSVIEVGIDVKKASLMIIFDATRFGLASLHQLRGRIGRDGYASKCYLVSDNTDEEETKKLKILENSLDGFEIATEDLTNRGPGEMGGFKQSGLPSFKYANIISDYKMFAVARDDAKYILSSNDPKFSYVIERAKKEAEGHNFTNV